MKPVETASSDAQASTSWFHKSSVIQVRTSSVIAVVFVLVLAVAWYIGTGGTSTVANLPRITFHRVEVEPVADREPSVYLAGKDEIRRPLPDDFSHAVLAAKSADPVLVLHWLERTKECLGFSALQDDLLVFIGGGISDIKGPLSDARRVAIDALVLHCSSFVRVGKSTALGLHQALTDRAMEIASEWIGGIDKAALFASSLKLLRSRYAALIEAGMDRLLQSVDLEVAASDEDVALLAMLGAACDFGVDCSSQGHKMIKMCALNGVCESDWTTYLTSTLNAEARTRFAHVKKQYVEWLRLRLAGGDQRGNTFSVDGLLPKN